MRGARLERSPDNMALQIFRTPTNTIWAQIPTTSIQSASPRVSCGGAGPWRRISSTSTSGRDTLNPPDIQMPDNPPAEEGPGPLAAAGGPRLQRIALLASDTMTLSVLSGGSI